MLTLPPFQSQKRLTMPLQLKADLLSYPSSTGLSTCPHRDEFVRTLPLLSSRRSARFGTEPPSDASVPGPNPLPPPPSIDVLFDDDLEIQPPQRVGAATVHHKSSRKPLAIEVWMKRVIREPRGHPRTVEVFEIRPPGGKVIGHADLEPAFKKHTKQLTHLNLEEIENYKRGHYVGVGEALVQVAIERSQQLKIPGQIKLIPINDSYGFHVKQGFRFEDCVYGSKPIPITGPYLHDQLDQAFKQHPVVNDTIPFPLPDGTMETFDKFLMALSPAALVHWQDRIIKAPIMTVEPSFPTLPTDSSGR